MWHFLVAKYLTSYGDVNVFAFSSPTWAELTTYVPEDISPNWMHDKKPDLFLPNSRTYGSIVGKPFAELHVV